MDKKRIGVIILATLLVISLIGNGAFAYLYMQKEDRITTLERELASSLSDTTESAETQDTVTETIEATVPTMFEKDGWDITFEMGEDWVLGEIDIEEGNVWSYTAGYNIGLGLGDVEIALYKLDNTEKLRFSEFCPEVIDVNQVYSCGESDHYRGDLVGYDLYATWAMFLGDPATYYVFAEDSVYAFVNETATVDGVTDEDVLERWREVNALQAESLREILHSLEIID